MKKILYLTIIPNPFQYEFTNGVSKVLEGKAELIPVFEKANVSFRSHWGTQDFGIVLNEKNRRKHFGKILDEIKPDILIFTGYNSRLTLKGILWANRNKKDYYFGPHEIIRPNKTYLISRYLKHQYYRFLAKNCKGVATMGNQAIRDIANIYNGPIVNIPYSFDLGKLLAMNPPSLEENELTFLFSGRLYDFRNPLLCIETFAKAKNKNPHKKIRLIISGTGPLEQDCLDLIEKRGITESVTWMNDFKNWYDIHNLYSHAHVLLALQFFGTWGLIIPEAMAAGLGIISTNTIQSADNLIINDYNGFLLTLNEEQILDKMQKYIDNPDLVNIHGNLSKQIVKTIDLGNSAKNFCKLIEPSLN